jgi:RNA recognition motif-containing protein
MKLFVGNLSRRVTQEALQQLFETFGQVESVDIIRDKFSGEAKGFGFIEMPSKDEAQAAMNGLNGRDLDGKSLTVNEARPRTSGPRTGGGGGERRFGGGGGGGERRFGGGGGGGERRGGDRGGNRRSW